MIGQDLGAQGNSVPGGDGPIGEDLQGQLVVVGHVTHAGVLHGVIDLVDRSVNGVDGDQADDGLGRLVAVAGHITSAVIEGQLHLELGIVHQGGDVLLGIEDLNVRVALDIAGSDLTGGGNIDGHGLLAFAVQLGDDALNIQDDLGHIFLHTGNGGKLMLDAIDLDGGGSGAGQRGKQNAAQRITEGSAVAALQGLNHELAVGAILTGIDTFNTGLFDCDH